MYLIFITVVLCCFFFLIGITNTTYNSLGGVGWKIILGVCKYYIVLKILSLRGPVGIGGLSSLLVYTVIIAVIICPYFFLFIRGDWPLVYLIFCLCLLKLLYHFSIIFWFKFKSLYHICLFPTIIDRVENNSIQFLFHNFTWIIQPC